MPSLVAERPFRKLDIMTILGLYWGCIGVIWGYIGVILGNIGRMEKKMETSCGTVKFSGGLARRMLARRPFTEHSSASSLWLPASHPNASSHPLVSYLVVSQNTGTPIKTLIYYNPCYGDPKEGTPNFGKPPFGLFSAKTMLARSHHSIALLSQVDILYNLYRTHIIPI